MLFWLTTHISTVLRNITFYHSCPIRIVTAMHPTPSLEHSLQPHRISKPMSAAKYPPLERKPANNASNGQSSRTNYLRAALVVKPVHKITLMAKLKPTTCTIRFRIPTTIPTTKSAPPGNNQVPECPPVTGGGGAFLMG